MRDRSSVRFGAAGRRTAGRSTHATQTAVSARAPEAPVGGRIPLATAAVGWVTRALDLLHSGPPWWSSTTPMRPPHWPPRPRREWVRTYRAGIRGHEPLRDPGGADITAEVPLDQIIAAHPGAEVSAIRHPSCATLGDCTIWRPRAAPPGTNALPPATSPHSRPAAPFTRPRPSATPPASAPSPSAPGTAERIRGGSLDLGPLVPGQSPRGKIAQKLGSSTAASG